MGEVLGFIFVLAITTLPIIIGVKVYEHKHTTK